MTEFHDQMNRTIRLESTPHRIVSLVPSQTQLLHFLELEEEVVGITKFCIHPDAWFRSKERVGGTKTVNLEKVKALNPDLIIGNKEENLKDDIEKLTAIAPVWMSDINSLDSALQMIEMIGNLTGKDTNSLRLKIQECFDKLVGFVESTNLKGRTVRYFIWDSPGMIAGKETFVDDMLNRCGLINATNVLRYPEVKPDISPDFIFLSSEPFPFKEKHLAEYQSNYPSSKICFVDGEMFSWYGSKLVDAPNYFMELLKSLQA